MNTTKLETDVQLHLQDLAASGYLAIKLSLIIVVPALIASNGLIPMGLTCLLLALAIGFGDRQLQIRDRTTARALAGSGLSILAIKFLPTSDQATLVSYVAAIPTGVLFLCYLPGAGTSHSFTNRHARVHKVPLLRKQHAQLWLVALAVATLYNLATGEHFHLKIFFVLALIAVAGHVFLQLMGVGKIWRPLVVRQIHPFRFERIENTVTKLKPLYTLYVTELMPSLQESPKYVPRPLEQLVQEKMQAEQGEWGHISFFAAYHEDQLIGTLSCQYDGPGRKLPFEQGHSQPLSLNRLREIGSIVELGKFCVTGQYRLTPEVFAGLLMCATEQALYRDVSFIVLQSVMRTARIYSKMGFTTLTQEPVINLEHGVKVQLLAKSITSESDAENRLMGNIQDYFSQYVFSRFVWRRIIKFTFLRIANKNARTSVDTGELPQLAVFG